MVMQVGSDAVVIYGLSSERLSPAGYPVGSLFVENDTGLEFSVGVDLEWFSRQQIVNINGKTMTRTALGGTTLSGGGEGGLVISEERFPQGEIAAPNLNGGTVAPNARINFGSVATPFSHCRMVINETTKGLAETALGADTDTEMLLPGVTVITSETPIFTIGLLGVFRDPLIAGTATASTANGTGTFEFGCISDNLDYVDGGTEVSDRTMFWDFSTAAPSGVKVLKIIVTPEMFLNQAASADSPKVASVRCIGYTF